jgi:hypothetical protein
MNKESCKELTIPPLRIVESSLKQISLKSEIKKKIISEGISSVLLPRIRYNFVGGKSGDSQDSIKKLLQEFLDNVITTDELIITDPYIFNNTSDSQYSDFVVSILEKYLKNLTKILFIVKKTGRCYNKNLENDICNRLRAINNSLIIKVKQSAAFHDRFWISDFKSKGLFIGCSLNSINKYFLVDYLKKDDVITITQELKKCNLI